MVPSPVDGLPPEVRAAFEALRARFRTGLADRWREIEGADSAADRCAALHRLAGAAGGYGFGEISRAAKRAEALAGQKDGPALDAALEVLRRLVLDESAS